jgi:DNA repair exonuclease SbcCD nuclease subunit
MPLSFVHAADFHLGADLSRFRASPHVIARLREAQFQALERTLDLAFSRQAAFVVICGDLFDRRDPSTTVVERTAAILAAFPSIPVFILPGTHDFLSDHAVLAPSRGSWAPANVVLLNDRALSPYHVPCTDVQLYFAPNRSNRSVSSPIAGMARGGPGGYHVGLAHGSVARPGIDVSRDFPIRPREIEQTKLDYLALGHWHSGQIQRHGRTTAAYPGIPQPLSFGDPEEGAVLLVTIDGEGNALVENALTSTVAFRQVAATIYHPIDLTRVLNANAGPNVIVKLALTFSDTFDEAPEAEKIIAEAASRYLLVQTENPERSELMAGIDTAQSADRQLIEAYLAELEHIREADSAERSWLYDQAAELGVQIIKGGE